MLERLRSKLLLVGLPLAGAALLACTVGTGEVATIGPGGGTGSSPPEQTAEINTPTSGLTVSATIASVTLGDQCAPAAIQGDCAGDCSSSCRSSNVQLAFTATAGSKAAAVEIVSVTLIDGEVGTLVDTLTSSRPQVWNGNGYVAWDQNVPPGGDLKASYDLTAPGWSEIDGNNGANRMSSYSRTFKLIVTLRIEGVEVVLESAALNRQPQAVT